ncbi:hypothetical protein [Microbulbifer yueqingensis]|uniref:Uncharacterized protein n=1 Tax=Microbulbifer yueqingensis TaxID=658219 RepID=A0A1G9BY37_9GAMM|nr:hypothetical protein [Microbulbifer yueqingensis]SDK44376.1 hypothetical protein SAMN05216212_2408 [Microbulbifer yueqingensis]
MKNLFDKFSHSKKACRLLGILGLLLVAPFGLWLLLGWLGVVPSLVEVFGVPGLRIPASIVIAGLLMAAVGFWEYD